MYVLYRYYVITSLHQYFFFNLENLKHLKILVHGGGGLRISTLCMNSSLRGRAENWYASYE